MHISLDRYILVLTKRTKDMKTATKVIFKIAFFASAYFLVNALDVLIPLTLAWFIFVPAMGWLDKKMKELTF